MFFNFFGHEAACQNVGPASGGYGTKLIVISIASDAKGPCQHFTNMACLATFGPRNDKRKPYKQIENNNE